MAASTRPPLLLLPRRLSLLPPLSTIARFGTSHVLGEDGRSCVVCKRFASRAYRDVWLSSECTPLEN
eukprot:9478003-Pyramimonas_sp.AAC.1